MSRILNEEELLQKEAAFDEIICFTADDFDANQLYVTVHIEDLIRNWKERESIGISLPSIRKRFEIKQKQNDIAEEYTISEIEHLVVRVSDIEEVLQMNIRNYYT